MQTYPIKWEKLIYLCVYNNFFVKKPNNKIELRLALITFDLKIINCVVCYLQYSLGKWNANKEDFQWKNNFTRILIKKRKFTNTIQFMVGAAYNKTVAMFKWNWNVWIQIVFDMWSFSRVFMIFLIQAMCEHVQLNKLPERTNKQRKYNQHITISESIHFIDKCMQR